MGATVGTRLMTWWKGELVGEDQFGNRYYREKAGKRRWVIYKDEPEASKVPPEWHAWLHYTIEDAPTGPRQPIAWEKPHVENLSGSPAAYHPSGSLVEQAHRPSATGDYEAWRPGD